MVTHVGHPRKQAIGAFDALERDDAAADRDSALADIERADRQRRLQAGIEIAPVGLLRRRARHEACAGEQVRHDLMRADHLEAKAFQTARPEPTAARRRRASGAAIARGSMLSSMRLGRTCCHLGRRSTPPARTTWVTPRRFSIGTRPAKFSSSRKSCSKAAKEDARSASPSIMATNGRMTVRNQAFRHVDGQSSAARDDTDPVTGSELDQDTPAQS